MTLRCKTLIIISASIICSLVVLYVVSSTILMRPFNRLDQEAACKNAERARDAISEQIAKLDAVAGDYAIWDETYSFVEDLSKAYVKVNLADDAFFNLGIEAMIFTDSSGRVVFGKAVDLEEQEETTVPEGLLDHIAPGKPLARHTRIDSSVSGILLLPSGPHLVASRPIVTSDRRGPIRGALIMVRHLDGELIRKVASVTHLSVALHSYEDRSLPSEVRLAIAAAGHSRVMALPEEGKVTAGYAVLPDLYHHPVLVLKAEGSAAIRRLGQDSVHYFLVPLVMIGLIAGSLVLFFVERAVLSRLARLSSGVTRIGSTGDLSSRVPVGGDDELSHVAKAVNEMLCALEASQRDLRESEERYRVFVEQSSEGVWRLELERPLPILLPVEQQIEHIVRYSVIAECNDILAQMHGYSRAEDLIGLRLTEAFRMNIRPIAELIRKFIRGGYRLTDGVTEHTDIYGKPRYHLNQVVGIVEDGALVRAWGVQSDVTEQRRTEAQLRTQISAINEAADQIIIADADGRIEFVNAAFERETGYKAQEAIGQNASILCRGCAHCRGECDEGLWKGLALVLQEGKTWQGEIVSRHKDGGIFTADTVITPVRNDKGEVQHLIAIKRDVTEKKVYEQKLDHLAHHDSLTGLPNRLLLSDRLAHRLSFARQQAQLLAVMFLDLDHFKFINDSLGHSVGDLLLKRIAERLTLLLRDVDTIARTGGDEFTAVLSGIASPEDAAKVAERTLIALSRPFLLENHELFVTASIGISLYPADGTDVETLVKHADVAMYRAKEQGRNNYQFFTQDLSAAALERMSIESNLRRALERGEFRVYYLPRMDINLETMLGAEALLRWQRPAEAGLVSPAQFIPVAEETGLIIPITEWVLRAACTQAKTWQNEGHACIAVDVNVSARQFHQHDLVSVIEQVLSETGLDPSLLGLEITESALMRNLDLTIRSLHRLKGMGLRLLIDDFGTGHSSLSHLKRFPIDGVKIDRSFVGGVTTSPDDAAVASAIVAIAHSLQLRVVAEGVERLDQLEFLRKVGCDEVQGYLITHPIPAEEMRAYLLSSRASSVV